MFKNALSFVLLFLKSLFSQYVSKFLYDVGLKTSLFEETSKTSTLKDVDYFPMTLWYDYLWNQLNEFYAESFETNYRLVLDLVDLVKNHQQSKLHKRYQNLCLNWCNSSLLEVIFLPRIRSKWPFFQPSFFSFSVKEKLISD